MKMTEHTKEPWEFMDNSLVGEKIDDHPIWLRPVILRSETGVSEANARRIVACVNACEGLDTEDLEQFGLGTAFGTALFDVTAQRLKASLDKIVDKAVEVERQCDQLLEALEKMDRALALSNPEGAMGEVFELWNDARRMAGLPYLAKVAK